MTPGSGTDVYSTKPNPTGSRSEREREFIYDRAHRLSRSSLIARGLHLTMTMFALMLTFLPHWLMAEFTPPKGLLHFRMAGDSLFPTFTTGTSQAGGPRAAAMVFQLARQAVGLRRGAANLSSLLSTATEVPPSPTPPPSLSLIRLFATGASLCSIA